MKPSAISRQGIINFIIVSSFLCFEMGVQASPNAMAEHLIHDLSLSHSMLGWLSSVYFYSYALMMVPVGLLYDRFRLKHLLLIALITLSAGNFLFAVVHPLWQLAAARFLMGFGSAFAFVGVLVVARDWFPARHFPLLVGVTQLLAAFGAMLGESPVAFLVDHRGWRGTSIIFGLIAAGLMVFILFFVRECTKNFQQKDPSRPPIKESLGRILRLKQTYWVAFYAFLSWGPITVFAELWGVPYLQQRFGLSNTVAAISPMVVWLMLAFSSPVLGRLIARDVTHRRLMQLTVFLAVLGSVVLFYWPGLSFRSVVVLSLFIGIGAAGQILSFDVVRLNNRPQEFALATGFNNLGVVFGGALLQPIAGWLIDLFGTKVTAGSVAWGYQVSMGLVPLCFVVAWIVARWVIRYPKQA